MDEVLPGVYFIRFERHLIFFRSLSADTVGVISVLHENMNIPMRLREEADSQGED
jgi:plasmid stabilization system protein ParE